MNEMIVTAFGCFALGLMTTMHPCPFTTNIAAMTFLSSGIVNKQKKIALIASFSVGYVFAIAGLALILNAGIVAIPRLSLYLQGVISGFLGPSLILVGMILSGLIDLNKFYRVLEFKRNNLLVRGSPYSSLLLGALLALTFCPATASIFFGIMVPLSIRYDQIIVFPVLYAIGALFPVVGISILIYHGFRNIFHAKWVKRFPIFGGGLMILIGVYVTIRQLYI